MLTYDACAVVSPYNAAILLAVPEIPNMVCRCTFTYNAARFL